MGMDWLWSRTKGSLSLALCSSALCLGACVEQGEADEGEASETGAESGTQTGTEGEPETDTSTDADEGEGEGEGEADSSEGETEGGEALSCWYIAEAGHGPAKLALGPSGQLFSLATRDDLGSLRVVEHGPGGEALWVAEYADALGASVEGSDVAVDDAGRIYITGQVSGQDEDSDALLLAYSNIGELLWSQRFGAGASGARGLRVDAEGNAYVTGFASGAFEGEDHEGGTDSFVAKFSAAGEQLWLVEFGNAYDDRGEALDVHETGVYVAARQNLAAVDDEGFAKSRIMLVKLTLAGAISWTRVFNESGQMWWPRDLIIHPEGVVSVAGSYTIPSDEPEGDTTGAIVAGYDLTGHAEWLEYISSPGVVSGGALGLGADGNIYYAAQVLDIGGGALGPDILLVALTAAGAVAGSVTRDYGLDDYTQDIAVGSGDAELYLSGGYSGWGFVTQYCPA
ncbi:hypothetical protein G6O69_06375 [Pseudenhygromyxa sp. WMMC2535]|uniref:SBBP repeat-containing protein n=1 Tax=Pseudenhygromyxa sp. WMMC2535 TaxID=2712867 RepID=UPI001595675A|nr:SBBP repeat-containing protein [Pseudenhygromyxa sp. WMMC2535]NVB37450.1 hypothetical protein [Pseudenhygromyxa sp. WMMC2535]